MANHTTKQALRRAWLVALSLTLAALVAWILAATATDTDTYTGSAGDGSALVVLEDCPGAYWAAAGFTGDANVMDRASTLAAELKADGADVGDPGDVTIVAEISAENAVTVDAGGLDVTFWLTRDGTGLESMGYCDPGGEPTVRSILLFLGLGAAAMWALSKIA